MISAKTRIVELNNEIERLKKESSETAWQEWIKESIEFLDTILGKCFVSKCNDHIYIFKVLSYKKKNWLGNPGRCWFELQTDGHFSVYKCGWKVATTMNSKHYGSFSAIEKKAKITSASYLNYESLSMSESCGYDTKKIVEVGCRNPKNYDDILAIYDTPPLPARTFLAGYLLYEIPETVYNEAKQIAEDNAMKTLEFWKRNTPIIEKAKII